uniref:Uncharacterized protein n=1 Tax=Cucumis melo TaxID=3656 RepID=A0A9I9E892_CUCME
MVIGMVEIEKRKLGFRDCRFRDKDERPRLNRRGWRNEIGRITLSIRNAGRAPALRGEITRERQSVCEVWCHVRL